MDVSESSIALGVYDPDTRRKTNMRSMGVPSLKRRQHKETPLGETVESIVLEYTVTTVTTESYEQLSSQLSSAVDDGDFDSLMHSIAVAYAATDLETAVSASIKVTDETLTSDDSGGGGKDGLSGGAIAGVVIGTIAGVALLGALLWYVLSAKRSVPMASQPNEVQVEM
jgi:hypothetical protein